MRIYLIIVEEPLFHPEMVEEISLSRKNDIIGITIVPDTSPNKNLVDYLVYQLNFFGPKAFVYFGVKTIISKVLDHSVKTVAKKYQIPVYLAKKINAPEHLEYLRKIKPDIIISAQGQIFKNDLLKIPKVACINRHSSLLPKYGGLWPVFWAMLNGEKQIGVTVHTMEEKIDGGKILAQKKIIVSSNDTLNSLYKKAFAISGGVILEALKKIEKPPVSYVNFNPKKRTYYSSPKTEDFKRFREKSLKIL